MAFAWQPRHKNAPTIVRYCVLFALALTACVSRTDLAQGYVEISFTSPLVDTVVDRTAYDFAWSTRSSRPTRYRSELFNSSSCTGAPSAQSDVPDPRYTAELAGGEYSLRVTALGGAGEPLGSACSASVELRTPQLVAAIVQDAHASFAVLGSSAIFAATDGVHGAGVWTTDTTGAGTVSIVDNIEADYFTTVGNQVFFIAVDGATAHALWRTDGTPSGTQRLGIISDTLSGFSVSAMSDLGGTLFFWAFDPAGATLWRSDGTVAGTWTIKRSTRSFYGPSAPALWNGAVLFIGCDGTFGCELWSTDGTAGSAALVADINPGAGNGASWLMPTATTIYVAANDGSGSQIPGLDSTLWKTDGTQAGTVKLSTLILEFGNEVESLNGTLLFAPSLLSGYGLWRSDGTSSGTVLLDANYGHSLGVANGRLFYTQFGTTTVPIWATDGTPAGTSVVRAAAGGTNASGMSNGVDLAGTVVFAFDDRTSGFEPWRSDGTAAGTYALADICPGSCASAPDSLTVVAGSVFFTASRDGTASRSLYVTNGTVAGTQYVADVGAPRSRPTGLTAVGGQLCFFAGMQGDGGPGPYCSAGPPTSVAPLRPDLRVPSMGIWASETATLSRGLLFGVERMEAIGTELWLSDGTTPGTIQLATSTGPTLAGASLAFGGQAVFAAADTAHGAELWRTDGTTLNTYLVADIAAGTTDSDPGNFAAINAIAYFSASDGIVGRELWRTDGTGPGTSLIADIQPGAGDSTPSFLTPVGSTLFFAAKSALGCELWLSDGTTSATHIVADINPGAGDALPLGFNQALFAAGSALLFIANDGVSGFELWRSDGTTAGTAMVLDINPGPPSSFADSPSLFAVNNGALYFAADDGLHGPELWTSNGAPAGTSLVLDINPGPASFADYLTPSAGVAGVFAACGTTMFLTATDGVHGAELWKSDGTPAGTTLVDDINPGPDGSTVNGDALCLDELLIFVADDGVQGARLWRSDGTPAGTYALPGSAMDPHVIGTQAGYILHTASDFLHGSQLWTAWP